MRRSFLNALVIFIAMATCRAQDSLNVHQEQFLNAWNYASDIEIYEDYAYLATWDSGLRVVSIADPSAPCETDSMNWYFRVTEGLARRDTLLFVATWSGEGSTLQILSVADPGHPRQIGHCEVDGIPHAVAVSGDYAYLPEDQHYTVRIVSIADPSNPQEVGHVDNPYGATGIAIQGAHAFVAEYVGLRVYDLTNPVLPVSIGSLSLPGQTLDVSISGNYAYVRNDSLGLVIVNISDPAHPSQVSAWRRGRVGTPEILDNLAFVPTDSGLVVLDITDHAHPVVHGSCCTIGVNWLAAVSGNIACVVGNTGFHTVNIQIVADPRPMGRCGLVGIPRTVLREANRVYLRMNCGLCVFDATDPTHLTQIGFYDLPDEGTVTVSGGFAYFCDFNALHIANLTDAAHPVSAGTISFGDSSTRVVAVDAQNSVACLVVGRLGDDSTRLVTVNVSDPNQPQMLGMATLCYSIANPPHIAVSGNYAAVLSAPWLFIVDITDRAVPRLVSSLAPVHGYDVAIQQNRVYSSWLDIISIADPAHPQRLTPLGPTLYGDVVAVQDNFALLGSRNQMRLQVVDLTDPAHLREAGYYDILDYANGVATDGRYCYVSEYEGLHVLDYSALLKVHEHSVLQPVSLSLSVSPNPFNNVAEIRYDLPRAGHVMLSVFDVLGRNVAVLVDGYSPVGEHRVRFDGAALSSGIYFVRLSAGGNTKTEKLMLLK